MIIGQYTITSLETITKYDLQTGDFCFLMDELQNASIANSEDKQDITGKGGRKITSLKRNKACTVSGTSGLIVNGLMEEQTGGAFSDSETTIRYMDYLTVNGDKATTSYAATGTAGDEVGVVFVHNGDGTLGTKYTQDATAGAGKFAYNPESKEISFNSGDVADGTEIFVCYDRKVNGSTLKNMSDVYSKKGEYFIDCLGEDKCGKVFHIQIHIPKGDMSGNFEIALGENQAVHNFEIEALAGACGTSGAFWEYTVFTDDAA